MTSLGMAPGCGCTRFGDNLPNGRVGVDKPAFVRFLSPKLCTATGQRQPGHTPGQPGTEKEGGPCVLRSACRPRRRWWPGHRAHACRSAQATGVCRHVPTARRWLGTSGARHRVIGHSVTQGIRHGRRGLGKRCTTPCGSSRPAPVHPRQGCAELSSRRQHGLLGSQVAHQATVSKRLSDPRVQISRAYRARHPAAGPKPWAFFHRHCHAAREAGTFFFLECNILK